MGKKQHNKKKQNKTNKQMMDVLIAYYKRNPDVFFERELGVKLTRLQKFILKRMRFK